MKQKNKISSKVNLRMTCEIDEKSRNVDTTDSESRKPSRGEIRIPKMFSEISSDVTSKESPPLLLVQSRFPGD